MTKDDAVPVTAEAREALQKAIETLAASRHLMGKYCPDHHWLPEHDQRIADLRAALSQTPATPMVQEVLREVQP